MIKLGIILLFIFTFPSILQAEIFKFKYAKGDKYRIITEVAENVYVDGRFNNRAEILNKISVEVADTRDSAGLLSGFFQVSERAWGDSGPYRLTDEDFTSLFWRDQNGRYDIESRYLMPIVRNIPIFPDRDLKPGDTWSGRGEEVHDLRAYGIDEPLRVPLDVNYTYLGRESRNDTEIALFDISYSASINLRDLSEPGSILPVKIMGNSQQTYAWDIERGRVHSYSDKFDFIYVLSNGKVMEFEGESNGRVIQSENLDRERVAGEIRREIEREGIQNTEVRPDEDGVTISLENINFPPESSVLLPSELKKLDKIAEILKNYPDRDILIRGHTALAGTPEGRLRLSEARARAVGHYLLSKGVRNPNQISFKGFGATKPIADNSTEEGRQKNRRVEIKILEN